MVACLDYEKCSPYIYGFMEDEITSRKSHPESQFRSTATGGPLTGNEGSCRSYTTTLVVLSVASVCRREISLVPNERDVVGLQAKCKQIFYWKTLLLLSVC